jgi:hypothetical protein
MRQDQPGQKNIKKKKSTRKTCYSPPISPFGDQQHVKPARWMAAKGK